MMFYKLVRYDLRAGLFQRLWMLLFPAVFILINCVYFSTEVTRLNAPYQILGDDNTILIVEHTAEAMIGTFGDYVAYTFAGVSEYTPDPRNPLVLPIMWLLLLLLLAFTVLYYPYNDLHDSGKNVLVRSGGRLAWWWSKCVWVAVTCAVYLATVWCTLLGWCAVTGVPWNLQVSQRLMYILELPYDNVLQPFENILPSVAVLTPLACVAICMMQTTLSLYIKPLYSFAATTTILFASVYFFTPLLPGNLTMAARSNQMVAGGIHMVTGVFIASILIIVSMLWGAIRFSRMDILREVV